MYTTIKELTFAFVLGNIAHSGRRSKVERPSVKKGEEVKIYACTRGDPREWKEIHISRFRWDSCDSCGEVPQVFGCYREKQQHTEDGLQCSILANGKK